MKQTNHARTTSLSHRDRKTFEQRRLKAGKFFKKGLSQAEVAKKLKVSRESARQWYNTWKKKGAKGLKSKGRPGPKSKLTEKKLEKIEQALLKGPQSLGYATDIWTLKRIAQVIKKVAKLNYKTTHVWRILTFSLGWSNQKPETRAKERNEKAIRAWKRRTWPSVKKKPRK